MCASHRLQAKDPLRHTLTWAARALGVAAGAYAGYAAVTWLRYGRPAPARAADGDALLDRFMPVCDVVERHHIDVAAPPGTTLTAACEQDLMAGSLVRAIFKAREVVLGSDRQVEARPAGLLEMTKSIGWGVLADVPGREIVMGAITQPWKANVVFRSLPPDEFRAFDEPGYVKIVWTLRADAIGSGASIFRTETRAVATDAGARAKFRRYWSLLSPGIILIRWALLEPLRAEAERRAWRHLDDERPTLRSSEVNGRHSGALQPARRLLARVRDCNPGRAGRRGPAPR